MRGVRVLLFPDNFKINLFTDQSESNNSRVCIIELYNLNSHQHVFELKGVFLVPSPAALRSNKRRAGPHTESCQAIQCSGGHKYLCYKANYVLNNVLILQKIQMKYKYEMYIISRPGKSQGLLYKPSCHSIIS